MRIDSTHDHFSSLADVSDSETCAGKRSIGRSCNVAESLIHDIGNQHFEKL